MRQTIEEESSPPERQDPIGTSERRCRRTESTSSDAEVLRRLRLGEPERPVRRDRVPALRLDPPRPGPPAAIATQQPGWS